MLIVIGLGLIPPTLMISGMLFLIYKKREITRGCNYGEESQMDDSICKIICKSNEKDWSKRL